MDNPYCEALGIKVPVLEELIDLRQANTYSLMIVALLERDGPMTLAEVAERFAEAGIAPAEWSLRSFEAVIGSAPGWAEPWARTRVCRVEKVRNGWGLVLLDEEGFPIDERDVQLARVVEAGR